MSEISLKSITGITSITTPAGVDNQLTVHNNNTTEAVKFDNAGNVHINNQLEVAGVSTFSGGIGSTITIAAGVGSTAITLDNSHKMTFGSAHELEMYHDGSNSYIKQRYIAYPSNLNIISENSQINIMSGSGGNAHGGYENAITCHNNGAVKLYYGGALHLETYGAGITVQGNIQLGDKLIHNGDADTCVRFPAHNTISFETTGSERFRIHQDGQLLVGHTTKRNNFNSAASSEHAPIIQLEGTNQKRAISLTATNGNDGGILMLARQNGNPGTNTVVSSGDQIGRVDFQASGGTNMELAAQITAEVDGTPGDNDMPGRLIFKTTADGASSSTERLRINSSGAVMINTTNSANRTLNLNGTFGILSTNQSGVIDMSVTDAGVASIGPYVAGGSSLELKTNASGSGVATRLKIHSSGYVTTPQQPAFSAQGTNVPVDSSEGYTGILSNYMTVMECNVGSHYKTSGSDEGKFVAPVAGNYFFSAGCLMRLRSGTNGSAELTFHKNGANIAARSLGYSFVTGTNDHDNLTITAIISLAAGDKVHLVSHACSSNLDWYWGEGLGNFNGYLIG